MRDELPVALSLELDDSPTDEETLFLARQINEYNFETTDIRDGRELMIRLRDPDGHLAAGLHGWTWGGCLEVASLWVREDSRGRGHGARLLLKAEEEAIRRGCHLAVLHTHDFQAPEFYKKYGYEVVGTVEDYPRGHSKIWMKKNLASNRVPGMLMSTPMADSRQTLLSTNRACPE